MLLGQVDGTTINLDEMEARLKRPEYAPMAKSLARNRDALGGRSVRHLRRVGDGPARPWLKDAQINRDRNLRLQYLAGRGLNLYHADAIFAEMLPYAQGPAGRLHRVRRDDAGADAQDTCRAGTGIGTLLIAKSLIANC